MKKNVKYVIFSKKYEIFLLLVFSLITITLIVQHEAWRDEAQAWLLVRDSNGFADLFNNLRYEGTPILWHMLLKILIVLDFPYWSMKILHFFLSFIGVFVFIFFSPFRKIEKSLFVFGYLILYEYCVIARSYVLTVMLLFILALVYKKRFNQPFVFGSITTLLANTNVFGLVIAIVISIYYCFENFSQRGNILKYLSVTVVGFLATLYFLIPPADLVSIEKDLHFSLDVSIIISKFGLIIASAFSPNIKFLAIPEMGIWIFGLSFTILRKKMLFVTQYCTITAGFLAIFLFKVEGNIRHFGMIYICFIFYYWLTVLERGEQGESEKDNFEKYIILILLIVQIGFSPAKYISELNQNYSASKEVAEYLMQNNLVKDTFIAGYQCFAASAILPYITNNECKFYYFEFENFGSYVKWNTTFERNSEKFEINDELLKEIKIKYKKRYSKGILILNYKDDLKGNLIKSFENSMTSDEKFYIYKIY